MKKVYIEPGCTSCSSCEVICPEVFSVKSTCVVKEGVDYKQYEEQIEEAALICPVNVIKFEK